MANLELLVQVQDRELQSLRKDIRTLSREMGGISTTNRRASASYTTLNREAGKADKSLKQATRGALAGSGAFRGLGRAVAFSSAAFLGAAGLSNIVRGAIDELEKAGQVAAQTNTVIKSTGEVAGVTAKHVDALAKSLLKKSGVDDEAIKSSENLLLAFTNVRNVAGAGNDVFDQATKSTLDLSIAMHRDLNSTALALGKALQDPIKGMTALRRVGVTFTAAQTATVKKLIESNRVLDAQKLILDEVRKRSEGAAKAYGNTLPGQIDKARESFRNLSASAIKPLLPDIAKAAAAAAKFFEKPSTEKQLREAVHAVADAFGQAAGAISTAKDAVGGWRNAIKLLIALKTASVITGWAKSVGFLRDSIGAADGAGALGRTQRLRTALKGLAAFGLTTIAIELVLNWKQIPGWIDDALQGLAGPTLPQQSPQDSDFLPRGGKLTNRDIRAAGRRARAARAKGFKLNRQDLETAAGTLALDLVDRGFTDKQIRAELKKRGYSANIIDRSIELWVKGYRLTNKQAATGTGSFDTRGAAAGTTKKQRQLVATARKLGPGSGITYHWGGISAKTGYDCSGFVYDVYKRNGISIPRTSQAQFADPNAIDTTGREKPGDAVFFNNGSSRPQPDHVGFYLGNDRFIEYFSEGKPAAVSTLAGYRHPHMGSRRWLKIKSSSGATPPQANNAPPKPKKKKKAHTTTLSDLFATPAGLAVRDALAAARGSKSTKDDAKALQGELRFLEKQLKLAKRGTVLRTAILEEIGAVKDKLHGGKKTAAGGELVPVGLRLGLSRAEARPGLQDDLKALRNIQTFLTGALKGTKGEKRLTILDELNNVKDRIGGVVRDILDKAKAEVEKRRTSLGTAFGKVADSLLSSFDEKTSQLVDGINSSFDALTPAEQELLGIQGRVRGRERVDLAATVEKAQKRLDRATGRRRATAQRDLDEARDALREFDLTPIADAERAAAEKRRTAALDALDKQRADERKALEDKIAAFQAMLEKGGLDMGTAFAKGILAGFPAFKKAVDQYGAYLEGKGLTGTPGSGTTGKLPIDPAIATAIRGSTGGTRAFQSVSATTPVIIQGGTFIGTNLDTAAADIAEALAKYNRRNGRQPV